ncbi:voltage-dependent calcium channel gamma-5 subunit-like protein [Leptotrombidium deliense]|uniref:Voltage-dependent calcium channel gamma-5 subunit-like protein n=1 Tax=Leptotrombidium deliense TaxID=299467 RepID=A0A443SGZ9_9ACAR|nr:voltage-dependent calcium channel gamma-5 subunit-like protein [Leptotrombidium deliense]
MNCSKIDYLSGEEYSPDPNDSTMAIPCLLILAGIVIYISTFKAEVGNKLRPKSSFQGPMFRYNYGFSFLFAVTSLMMCEVVGTFSIFLYIRVHQLEWKKEFEKQQYIEYLPTPTLPANDPPPPIIYCKKHGGRGRRYSRTKELSRDASPIHIGKSSRTPSLTVPGTSIPLSDSMRDLTYFNFPSTAFSRETTCNTVSTAVDINRDYSREFSPRRESLYRTEYPPPIREHEFMNNEYSNDYSSEYLPRSDLSRDSLRRTTPV